jgi:hypothetical protein
MLGIRPKTYCRGKRPIAAPLIDQRYIAMQQLLDQLVSDFMGYTLSKLIDCEKKE